MRGEGGEAPAISPGPDGSVVVAGTSGLYTIADGSRKFRPVPHTLNSMPGFSALPRALGDHYGPRHLSYTFWDGDGVAERPSGTILRGRKPVPWLGLLLHRRAGYIGSRNGALSVRQMTGASTTMTMGTAMTGTISLIRPSTRVRDNWTRV